MRTLVIDIETRPNLAYVWGLWDQNVGLSQLVEAGSVVCFAAKWVGERRVMFWSDHHDGHDVMVKAAHDLLSEADAVVHYNGRAFDIKHLHREMLLAGLAPPAAHKDIDLLTVVRSRFKFASNKLDHVASELGLGSKLQHSGFDLWVRCMAGDDRAWAQMKRYNMQDVRLTEALYERVRPWVKNHPNMALYADDGPDRSCPSCGSGDLMSRGYMMTAVARYRRLQCKACGAWSQVRTSDKTAALKSA